MTPILGATSLLPFFDFVKLSKEAEGFLGPLDTIVITLLNAAAVAVAIFFLVRAIQHGMKALSKMGSGGAGGDDMDDGDGGGSAFSTGDKAVAFIRNVVVNAVMALLCFFIITQGLNILLSLMAILASSVAFNKTDAIAKIAGPFADLVSSLLNFATVALMAFAVFQMFRRVWAIWAKQNTDNSDVYGFRTNRTATGAVQAALKEMFWMFVIALVIYLSLKFGLDLLLDGLKAVNGTVSQIPVPAK